MRKEKLLKETGGMPIYLTSPSDMRYYTGFTGEGGVIISENEAIILTDGRYTFQAKEESSARVETSLKHSDFLKKYERIYFQPKDLSFDRYSHLKSEGVNLIPFGGDFDFLRCVKDEYELECLERAAEIGDKVFNKILADIKVGVSEREISAKIDYYIKELGGEGNSFETICASGVNSCKPHGAPTDKKIKKGDFVTMDFGCIYKGYCSDMTRTVAVGFASDEMKRVYDVVLRAQESAESFLCAGKRGKEVDLVARNIIKDAGYGEMFTHSLGHGVGIKIHEKPNLSPNAEIILEKNNVVTIEPGIYIDGKFGVRIENTLVVGENTSKSLQKAGKELIIL